MRWLPPHSHLRTLIIVAVASALAVPAAGAGTDPGERVARLNELLKELPTVYAEARGDEVVVTGWVRDKDDTELLKTVLKTDPEAIDLTGPDLADPQEMVEVDVIIVVVYDTVTRSVGFDFLQLVQMQFNYFDMYHAKEGAGLSPSGGVDSSADAGTFWGHVFSAEVEYAVNIANATDQSVNIVARPHLTTLNGETAEFLAGGEIVFKVSGLNSGSIKPYPYGINLKITPTVLRTPGPAGEKQVMIDVDASRLSVLGVRFVGETATDDVSFDKVQVKSKAVLPINETLILSGLYQLEKRSQRSGVPILRDIPIIKYFFSRSTEVDDTLSTVIFITPREPGILNEKEQEDLENLIHARLAYIRAREKGDAAIAEFKKTHTNWYKPKPNRYASHFALTNNSAIYRELRGEDLRTEEIRRDIMSVASAMEASRKKGRF
jgi:hypothetical protein